MVVGRRSTPGSVPDVGDLLCPENPGGGRHQILAGGRHAVGPGRPATEPVWACLWCGVSWGDLDEQLRADLRAGTLPRIASPA